MDEMEQMMRTEQQQKKEQQNDENGDGNATERIGINQCDQPDDELPKKPVNGQAAKKEENAYAQQQGAEEGEGDEQPYAFHHHDFFMQMHRNECTFYEYIKRNAAEKQWATPVPEVYFTQLGLAQQLERGTGADEGETMTTTTKTTKENGQAVEGQRNGLILMEVHALQSMNGKYNGWWRGKTWELRHSDKMGLQTGKPSKKMCNSHSFTHKKNART